MINDLIKQCQELQEFRPPTTKEQWHEFLWGAEMPEDDRELQEQQMKHDRPSNDQD